MTGDTPACALSTDVVTLLTSERHRLAELRDAVRAQEDRVAALEARAARQVQSLDTRPDFISPAEKVSIFAGLFRGRADVWPRLWLNAKTGKKGYAPVCANDWVQDVCGKPKVKCGACPNQAFAPLTERVLREHLQGRHTVGVYVMLPDDTCWFVAADFDESQWQADVLAYAQAGRAKGLDIHIERSRSGNGAHAWLFFAEPVQAVLARKLGSHLLTEASAAHPALSLRSYDRLFPSQDVLPKGGFGNLIALPLQRTPRLAGNSVIVDDDFRPLPDQSATLAAVRRTTRGELEALVHSAERAGSILGLPRGDEVVESTDEPWHRPPSGPKLPPIVGPMPARLQVVLAQRLFIATSELPPALVDRLRRLAAFANPEFHKKQAMRMPTTQTPRIIACANLEGSHLSLPRGCLGSVLALLADLGVCVDVRDERQSGEAMALPLAGTLRAGQQPAVDAMAAHDGGILVAPPGSGKTVMGVALMATRARNTLILVHRLPLVEQWRQRISEHLAIPLNAIGVIAAGKRKPSGRIDVAMLQSLVHDDRVDDIVATYGHVIVDECHHVPAVSFERVLNAVRAKFVTGLTATPRRRDGLHPIAEMQFGPVRHVVAAVTSAVDMQLRRTVVVRHTGVQPESLPRDASIQEVYAALATDESRNDLIAQDVLAAVVKQRRVLVLTERVEHLRWFEARLAQDQVQFVSLHGGLGAKARRAADARWHDSGSGVRVLLATGRYVGEGFDDPRLDTLMLASPLSWRGTLVQYVGRLTRQAEGKQDLLVHDYVDVEVAVLRRMFERRRVGYRDLGFALEAENRATPGRLL